MLKLTVKPGEYLLIGNEIKLVFAGGSSNNLRILVDAPKSMNIARSSALEKKMMEEEPGNMVTHYRDQELSKEAQEKIKAILMEERRKVRMEKRVQSPAGVPRRQGRYGNNAGLS
ncbi:MAG: carbon storage regulator [Eubacterium sp.]|nr:carbon storage regulator [Eubacterium sp.]